jgi:hypothetical protein
MIPPTINTPPIEINTPSIKKSNVSIDTIHQTNTIQSQFLNSKYKIQKINSTFHQSSQI